MDFNNITSRINAAQTQRLLEEDQNHLQDTRQEIRGALSESIAESALQNEQLSAFQDTIEDLSMALGSRLKDRKTKGDNTVSDPRNALLEQLAEESDLSGLKVTLGDMDTLLSLLDSEEIPLHQALMMMASWGGNEALDGKKRKKIKDKLQALMDENPQWGLEMFSEMELGDISPQTLSPLLQVMKRHQDQQNSDDAQGMWQWFEQVKDWPQRTQRIRVMLRTLALELAHCTDPSQQERLAATILDLKKLILFLGIEEHSERLAAFIGLPAERVMQEILHTIEQTWVNDNWVAQRLKMLSLGEERAIRWLGRFMELLKFLPELCFLDDEQRSQIIEAFTVVYDRLSDEE